MNANNLSINNLFKGKQVTKPATALEAGEYTGIVSTAAANIETAEQNGTLVHIIRVKVVFIDDETNTPIEMSSQYTVGDPKFNRENTPVDWFLAGLARSADCYGDYDTVLKNVIGRSVAIKVTETETEYNKAIWIR